MKSAIKLMRLATAATLLVAALAHCARGQSADDDAERRSDCRRATGSERRRCESEMGAPGSPTPALDAAGRPAQLYGTSLPLARIDEDLDYLREAAGHLSRAASRGDALDLKAVEKTASEVRKRAGRLRDLLILPDAPKEEGRRGESDIGDASQLREALRELSGLLAEAVRNPVLTGYLLDPAMSAEALRELDEIVELSERIRAGGGKLFKTRR